jgi:hypothetical protein
VGGWIAVALGAMLVTVWQPWKAISTALLGLVSVSEGAATFSTGFRCFGACGTIGAVRDVGIGP